MAKYARGFDLANPALWEQSSIVRPSALKTGDNESVYRPSRWLCEAAFREEIMVTRMLYGVDPFRNIRRLQDEVSRGAARALEFPAVNVFVNQDGVIITAEL